MDGVIWSVAPPALPYSLRLFRFTSKEREREGQCLVRSPSSIEYRYSPSPSPSSVFLPFFFFFQKFVSDCVLLFLCVAASPHMPSTSFFSSFLNHFFARPRLSIHSLLPARRPPPARSPLSISYRIVLYYNSPSNRPTNQPSLRNLDGRYSTVYIFERSESGS